MADAASPLGWGIISTGDIAGVFAEAVQHSTRGRLVAVGSRRIETAQAFARRFPPARAHGSYEALLADPEVEAVYIATPHPFHAENCLAAARAGKHILCEKPLTMNRAEAVAVAEAARAHGVFLMEAFMYRCHPQTEKLVELVRSGVLGRIGVIHATLSFRGELDVRKRHFANELGGGGILDVGCYPLSVARLVAGAARGKAFAEPLELNGFAELYPETGTDRYAVASARFEGGILAQCACGVGLRQENGLWILGTEGSLHLPLPFFPARHGGEWTMFLTRGKGTEPETIRVQTDAWLYTLEADEVARAVRAGERESARMPVADSLGNMAALDAWRAAAGVVYPPHPV